MVNSHKTLVIFPSLLFFSRLEFKSRECFHRGPIFSNAFLPILLPPSFFKTLSFSVTSVCCPGSAERCRVYPRCWMWFCVAVDHHVLFEVAIIYYLH